MEQSDSLSKHHDNEHHIDDDCPSDIPGIVSIRRYATFFGNIVGLIPCVIHLIVLIYLQWTRKSKSFEHLVAIAVLSIVTLTVSASGFAIDLCFLPRTEPFSFFRRRIWLFANNALFCAYAYMMVMLCFDRFLALHKPKLYRDFFIKPAVRILMVFASIGVGCVCCSKWLVYENDNLSNTTHSKGQTGTAANTNEVWFILVRLVSCIMQYFLPGALMIGFSVSNVQKLRYREKKMHSLGKLRMAGPATEFWQQSHETVARICTMQAVSYCLLNWPYMFVDYLYDDSRRTNIDFGILMIFGNLMQCLYLQINVLLFAYRSRLYRRTLVHLFFNVPYDFVKHLFAANHSEEDTGVEKPPSLRKIVYSTRFVELMAVL